MDANTLTSEPKTSAEVYGARATTFPSQSSRLMSVTSSTRTSCSNPCKNASTRLVRERPRAQSTWQEASTSGLAQGITSAPERPMQNFSRACVFRPPAPAVHAALVGSAPTRNSVPTGTAQFPWSPGGKALLNSHRRPACRPSGKLPSTLANATRAPLFCCFDDAASLIWSRTQRARGNRCCRSRCPSSAGGGCRPERGEGVTEGAGAFPAAASAVALSSMEGGSALDKYAVNTQREGGRAAGSGGDTHTESHTDKASIFRRNSTLPSLAH